MCGVGGGVDVWYRMVILPSSQYTYNHFIVLLTLDKNF